MNYQNKLNLLLFSYFIFFIISVILSERNNNNYNSAWQIYSYEYVKDLSDCCKPDITLITETASIRYIFAASQRFIYL